MTPNPTRDAALFYRTRHGWNPLPSRSDAKRPIGCYAELFDTPAESLAFDRWDAENVQLMCGTRWNLAVIDLDGDEAVDAWHSLTLHRPSPRTWTVRTGGGNWHLWYRTAMQGRELPSRLVWDGGGKHNRIDLLGDRSLVVAPPSRHVETGMPYTFAVGPEDMPEPAIMPGWMAELPDVRRRAAVPYVPPAAVPELLPTGSGTFDRHAVLAAIRDKVGLARTWGLRIVGEYADVRGWFRCRALNREDSRPSAGFHERSGYYSEPPNYRLSLFDIAVARGVYRTWQDAVNALGHRYGARSA